MSRRNEDAAIDVLDAMRLALIGAANDRAALEALKALLKDAPSGNPKASRPVQLLLKAIQNPRTRLALRTGSR